MSSPAAGGVVPATLRRALGRWDLTAVGVNQVIGGAIFLMPAQLAAVIGNWAPIGFVLAGIASLLVALCFAEVGSRFERTGGPYLYTRAAFGPFIAFEVGWMQWFTRATSQASIVNGIALALGFYWPAMAAGPGRAALITATILGLAWINVRGIRQSAWVVNVLTIGKLAPLGIFVLVGLAFADWSRLAPLPPVTLPQAASAGLLLIFTFGGFDVVSVPAGESTHPRRDIPFAFITTIAVVTIVMTLAHLVAMTTLGDLAGSTTPLADSAATFMGPAGAALIGIGSVISMTGNNAGQVLTGSRMLFALGENRALPAFFRYVHPVYRTPTHAIWFTSIVALALALSGSFAFLAIVSAVARLVTYLGTSAATLALRSPRFADTVRPATFVIPFGPWVPILALLVSVAILAGSSGAELVGGAAALAVGAVLFAVNAALERAGQR